jgi:pilus assembly protein Flp/PilA
MLWGLQSVLHNECRRWSGEREDQMTELFLNAFVAVRGFHGSLLERAKVERGASMVEYALLVGLIAIVAVVAVIALGHGISGLFGSANNCVGGLNSTNC